MASSDPLVVKWIKVFGQRIEAQLKNDHANDTTDASPRPFTMEMDEIYTFVQTKRPRALVWTAYCRETGKIIVYLIGEGTEAAIQLYEQAKANYSHISYIDTDANSCYASALAEHKVQEQHMLTKAETHLASTKSWEMLHYTLLLFFNQDKINVAI